MSKFVQVATIRGHEAEWRFVKGQRFPIVETWVGSLSRDLRKSSLRLLEWHNLTRCENFVPLGGGSIYRGTSRHGVYCAIELIDKDS